jgi:hypothetical protein
MNMRATRTRTLIVAAIAMVTLTGCAHKPGYSPHGDPYVWTSVAIFIVGLIIVGTAIVWLFWSLNDRLAEDKGWSNRKRRPWWWFQAEPKQAPIEMLLRMSKLRDRAQRAEVAVELSRRLPRLTAEEYSSYDQPTRERMYRALDGDDVEVAIAMLDMFRRFEDLGARPHVERLHAKAERQNSGSRLSGEARKCLEVLNMAAAAKGEHLLRPATGDTVLLRPASSIGNEPGDQLLRASQTIEDR